MQYLHEAFGGLRLARVHFGILAQNMKANLSVDDLDKEAIDGATARSDLLQNTSAFLFLFDRHTDSFQLTLKAIYSRQQLLLFFRRMGHEPILLDILYPV